MARQVSGIDIENPTNRQGAEQQPQRHHGKDGPKEGPDKPDQPEIPRRALLTFYTGCLQRSKRLTTFLWPCGGQPLGRP
jgi:hypothetical protein